METFNYPTVIWFSFSIITLGALFYLFIRQRNLIREQKEKIRFLKSITVKIANEVATFERTRIAENLHDDVGTQITVVRQNLERVVRNSSDPDRNMVLLKESMNMLSQSCQSIRNISHEVPMTLIQTGYIGGMQELCRQLELSENLKIEIHCDPNEKRLPLLNELYLFRISRELIINLIKHANPNEMQLKIYRTDKGLETKIYHDGTTISESEIEYYTQNSKGLGLKGIRKKMEEINATIQYGQSGQHSCITIIASPYGQ